MTKSKLFATLNFIPTPELRETINNVIADNRKISLDKAKFKKCIRPNEVRIIKNYFGIETA